MRAPGAVVGALALLTLTAGCTGGGDTVAGPASTPGATSTTSAPAPSSTAPAASTLPGTEALSPPAADPAAAAHLTTLAGLQGSSLRGHVALTVSGLVGFDEDVTGTCTTSPTVGTLTVRLADGSTDTTTFDATGASTVLRAPDGTTSTNTLQEVQMSVESDELTLTAGMVTEGTTEPSGSLVLTASCS